MRRTLIRAFCLRDFSHKTLEGLFIQRQKFLSVEKFLKDNSLESKEYSDKILSVNGSIKEHYDRRFRQRFIICNIEFKHPEIFQEVFKIYEEHIWEIALNLRENSDRTQSCENIMDFILMSKYSPVKVDILDEILGELCLKKHYQELFDIWDNKLVKARDAEALADETDISDDDIFMIEVDSYDCEIQLEQFRDQFLYCEKKLLPFRKKYPEDFENINSDFENINMFLEDLNSETHYLEDLKKNLIDRPFQ